MHRRLASILPLLLVFTLMAPLPAQGSVMRERIAEAAAPTGQAQPGGQYVVRSGDTLSGIARSLGISLASLIEANDLANPNLIRVGQRLTLPGGVGSPAAGDATAASGARGSIVERLPQPAREAGSDSPFHDRTWITYYGRPGIPVMGILGEYGIDDLVPVLRDQAAAYDAANGPDLGVTAAFHLIYGMATKHEGQNGSHLAYLADEVVMQYIELAQTEGLEVILDVQIGALSPLDAIRPGLDYLKYGNVHLALDPEFAMTSAGQTIPGRPPGMITAEQIDAVQQAMADIMAAEQVEGRRALVVHQFLASMIDGKERIGRVDGVDVVICADGFGGPWPKISKYNLFMAEDVPFAGFKLFYRWDEPLLSAGQVMGAEPYPGIGYMQVTPSLVIYQ